MGSHTQRIRHDGRVYDVIDHLQFGRHRLLILERMGSRERRVYRAFEPGVAGQMRCVHVLPHGRDTFRRLRLLTKLSSGQSQLPFIIDSVRRGDEVVVLTKWIEGPTLAEYLRQCRSGKEPWPSPLIVMNLVRGLAGACRLLHERLGVVHGDLHPDNLILCRHTKRLVPIDFGSAWYIETIRKRPSGDGAARLYSAPELQKGSGGKPGLRSDQFSVMSICYELLTGKVPYDGLGGRVVLASEREGQSIALVAPSDALKHAGRLPSKIRACLDEVVCRGLAADPNERYASTRAWLDALQGCSQLLHGGRETPAANTANRWLLRQVEKLDGLWHRKRKS